jgi:hypothetical protein
VTGAGVANVEIRHDPMDHSWRILPRLRGTLASPTRFRFRLLA